MKKREDPEWQIKKRKIYLILFEESKRVFVNDTMQEKLVKVYDEHYREKYAPTRQSFSECKQAGILPPMYLLEEIEGTSSDAFQHQLSWSRYFSEHGYQCLASRKVLEIIHSEADDPLLQSIKNIPIRFICSSEKNFVSDFGKRKKEKDISKHESGLRNINLALTDEQYQMVRRCSREKNISMREFIVNCLDEKAGIGMINSVQMEKYLQKIGQYVHGINAFQWQLQEIIDKILCAKEYEIPHLQQMKALAKKVQRSNETVCEEIIRLYQQLRRMKKW